MARQVETLPNGCKRYQKIVVVNGQATKVWVEKDPPEAEARTRRHIDAMRAKREGYSGIKRGKPNPGYARIEDKRLAADRSIVR